MRKWALIMSLPEGKLPGYYAQIVKALAEDANLYDRDKEVLIVNGEEDLPPVEKVMQRYKVNFDTEPLLLLPKETRLTPNFDDYGFVSRSENVYAFADKAAVYSLEGHSVDPVAITMAEEQLKEHIFADYELEGVRYCVTERQLTELVQGIAKAYGCRVRWIDNWQ